jgi:hypothetical protein
MTAADVLVETLIDWDVDISEVGCVRNGPTYTRTKYISATPPTVCSCGPWEL